jgi:hypothetical protein
MKNITKIIGTGLCLKVVLSDNDEEPSEQQGIL